MKKYIFNIILLAMPIIVCADNIEIGKYYSSFFERDYTVSASEPDQNGSYNVYVNIAGEHRTDDVRLSIKSTALNAWKESLERMKSKFLEWKKVAIENNVTEMDKDYPFTLPSVTIAWYGSKWWFAFDQRLKPRFKIFADGSFASVIYEKCVSSTNQYIDQQIYLVLQTEEEFNQLQSLLDKEKIDNLINKSTSTDDLFK